MKTVFEVMVERAERRRRILRVVKIVLVLVVLGLCYWIPTRQ